MKEIQLTQGQVTLVDDEDYEYLNQWNWQAHYNKKQSIYYATGVINKNFVTMHRLILNAPKDMYVDHINHNTLDNRKENLRLATLSENQYNRKRCKRNTSGYKGVSWSKLHNKWRARICITKERLHLGLFDTAEEAYKIYCAAAEKYHGEFAYTQ
jgi:hypothetical protein